jgi:hypothetical protein
VELDNYMRYGYLPNEPIIEVRDKGTEVDILVEANGSKEKDVLVEKISGASINISLVYKGRRIRKKVTVQHPPKLGKQLIRVKNGVALIRLYRE